MVQEWAHNPNKTDQNLSLGFPPGYFGKGFSFLLGRIKASLRMNPGSNEQSQKMVRQKLDFNLLEAAAPRGIVTSLSSSSYPLLLDTFN